jgi:hypothetical protein
MKVAQAHGQTPRKIARPLRTRGRDQGRRAGLNRVAQGAQAARQRQPPGLRGHDVDDTIRGAGAAHARLRFDRS